jgi:hypothetical protein
VKFVSNERFQKARQEAGFPIHWGESAPLVEGEYEETGRVVDSNYGATGRDGSGNLRCYYDQRDGRVKSLETAPGRSYRSEGRGQVIKGESGKFTIFADNEVRDPGTPCPYQRTYTAFSATEETDGSLDGQFLTVVVETASGCGVSPGTWRLIDTTMQARGTCMGSRPPSE